MSYCINQDGAPETSQDYDGLFRATWNIISILKKDERLRKENMDTWNKCKDVLFKQYDINVEDVKGVKWSGPASR